MIIFPMDYVDSDSSVPDWVIEYPRLLPLFEKLGIDYSCGGKSLRTACNERGLDLNAVLSQCESIYAAGEDHA